MIPIECPKCGRGGSVPPDRLNARLVCKVCHTVFHLDNTGRMMLGEPGSNDPKKSKPKAEARASREDFDLAQTLRDIPKPVKFGVPGVLVAVLAYMALPIGGGAPDHLRAAETVAQALISNNRSKVISYSTSDSSDAAGKWFDLMHAELEKNQINSSASVSPAQLMSGNASGDSSLDVMVLVSGGGSGGPAMLDLTMQRSGGSWLLSGTKSLEKAEKLVAASTPAKKGG